VLAKADEYRGAMAGELPAAPEGVPPAAAMASRAGGASARALCAAVAAIGKRLERVAQRGA
jgi:hypothetical protein